MGIRVGMRQVTDTQHMSPRSTDVLSPRHYFLGQALSSAASSAAELVKRATQAEEVWGTGAGP